MQNSVMDETLRRTLLDFLQANKSNTYGSYPNEFYNSTMMSSQISELPDLCSSMSRSSSVASTAEIIGHRSPVMIVPCDGGLSDTGSSVIHAGSSEEDYYMTNYVHKVKRKCGAHYVSTSSSSQSPLDLCKYQNGGDNFSSDVDISVWRPW